MTVTAPVSNLTQVLKIIPRDYEVFGGLDVDHHSIVVAFAEPGKLLQRREGVCSSRRTRSKFG